MTGVPNGIGRFDVVAYLGRLSTRERYLILGAAFVALTLAPLKAYDWDQAALAAYQGARADLDSQNEVLARSHTGYLRKQLESEYAAIDRWAWPAPSLAIGRVMIEEQVSNAAEHAGLMNALIKSNEVTQHAGDVDFISVDVSAPFTWTGVDQFLHALSAKGRAFQLQSISLELGNISVVKLTIRAAIRVASTGGSPGSLR